MAEPRRTRTRSGVHGAVHTSRPLSTGRKLMCARYMYSMSAPRRFVIFIATLNSDEPAYSLTSGWAR